MTSTDITSLIDQLSAKAPPSQFHNALEVIASAELDPITLDQYLRKIAKRLDAGIKAVRQTYDIILKKLNLKPTDLGLAIAKDLLAKQYDGGIGLKLAKDEALYAYGTTHWERASEHKIRAELQEIAAAYTALTSKSLHSLVNDALGSLKDYLGNQGMVLTDDPLPVINCLNGELWIDSTGNTELRPHKPESLLMHCLPYNYDAEAACPRFDQVMSEIFSLAEEPDEMFRHACELMGYAIQPRRPTPCFWLLIGHGANGKTKFLQTLSRLISQNYICNVELSSFGRDKFNMAQLQGKLLMLDDDLKIDTVIPDGLLKKVSESKWVTARFPYGRQSITFLCVALPIMIGNHYPLCEDLSDGLLRRAMIIPFRKQFLPHEQDNGKFEYIWENEMPGVLNRAIEGYKRIIQRNEQFNPPKECVLARDEFLAHGNPFFCFLSECLEKDADSRIPFPHLRQHYEAWAKEQNIERLKTLNKTLKRRLQALKYEIATHNGYPCVMGYKLRKEE